MAVDLSVVRVGIHAALPGPRSENTSEENLFGEGMVDDADDELEESEPSLDDLVEQGRALRLRLADTLHELDSWISLAEHHKKSRKYNNN